MRDDELVGDTAPGADVRVVLLGGFSVAVDGRHVSGGWRLRKAKTLVKLLALASGHRLHRDVVIDVMWLGAERHLAANNLHQLLYNVRRMIGSESIALVDDVVRLCPAGGLTVDVELFEQAAASARRAGELPELRRAVQLWTGPLLPEDLYADWAMEHRERLAETYAAVVALLGSKLVASGDAEAALAVVEPLAPARPCDEQLHHVLVEALAASGRRWEAVEAFERLRDALDEAYAAEPQPQTKELYRRLLSGGRSARAVVQPPTRSRPAGGWTPVLVGREEEWSRLRSVWRRMGAGNAHLLLITGEAGIGKTRLAEQLLAWADKCGIATARTRCYSAEGRLALAPVSEWLRADVIRRSWYRLEDVWLTELARLLPELLADRPQLQRPEAVSEFGQRHRFFEALARAVRAGPRQLILLIDDLQWCDPATLQWLQFLLHCDLDQRLLLVGTARVEELLATHPVTQWLQPLRAEGTVTEVALEPLTGAETARLAAQVVKRDLDDRSAEQLYRETEGNPLFVVEMARAGLGKSARQRWSRGRDFSSDRSAAAALPPRMQAVIAGRLAQLSPGARELAGLAAVVGRVFTIEVLREAGEADPSRLNDALDELWHRRIVRASSHEPIANPSDRSTSEPFGATADSFDFTHDKIRDVAYAELGPVRRCYWHMRIAQAIERINGDNLGAVSAELAAHYDQAGEPMRAVPFYLRAAEVAQRLYAHQEAITIIGRGFTLLERIAQRACRDTHELELLRLLSLSLVATHGYGAPEVLHTLSRARGLNERLGKPPDPALLRAMAIATLNRGNLSQAQALGRQLLRLANEDGDPILQVEAHYVLGVTLFWTGSLIPSRTHLRKALRHYRPTQSPAHITSYSQDPGVICQCRLAFDLLCLGRPDEAIAAQDIGLARAQALAHPFSLAYALTWDAMLHGVMGDFDALLRSTGAITTLGKAHQLGLWSSWATVLHGWAIAEAGNPSRGVTEVQRGDAEMRAAGSLFLQPFVTGLQAEQLARMGQLEHALSLLNAALTGTGTTPSWYDAELHRLFGQLLAQRSDRAGAEAAYGRATRIARTRHATLFELRATTSLARLWLDQGKAAEAHRALTDICGRFAEGLDCPDVNRARELLDGSTSEPTRQ